MLKPRRIRRSRGLPLSPAQQLDMIEHRGQVWWLYENGALPPKNDAARPGMNIKLVADGWVKGKANWRLLWTGVRVSLYNDGARLQDSDPELFEVVQERLRQCYVVANLASRSQDTAGKDWDKRYTPSIPHADSVSVVSGIKSMHRKTRLSHLTNDRENDDGSDLI